MDLRAILMGLTFAVIWSSAFTSARIIVADAPPLTALSLRFLIGGLLGIAIARARGQGWPSGRGVWRAIVIFGICQNGLYLGLNFVAMQQIEASLAAIIASTMPLLVAFAGWILFGDRLPRLGIAGLIAGTVGVGIIMGARLSGGADLIGVLMCVFAVLSLTAATLAVRGASSGGDVLMVVGVQMLIGSLALAGPAVMLEQWEVTWSLRLILAFAYTTLVPGLVATLVWFLLVQRIGAVKAATFHFLTPFFGVAVAAALLGERMGVTDVIGVAVIAAGILAVQLARQEAAKKTR